MQRPVGMSVGEWDRLVFENMKLAFGDFIANPSPANRERLGELMTAWQVLYPEMSGVAA